MGPSVERVSEQVAVTYHCFLDIKRISMQIRYNCSFQCISGYSLNVKLFYLQEISNEIILKKEKKCTYKVCNNHNYFNAF